MTLGWKTLFAFLLLATTTVALALAKEVVPDLPASLVEHPIEQHLIDLEYDVGFGQSKAKVYLEPNVTTFYSESSTCPASTKVTPKFNGFAAKFINLSKEHLRLYWEVYAGGDRSLIQEARSFTSVGTASFPRHRFVFVHSKTSEVVQTFIMDPSTSVYFYDPYHVPNDPEQTETNLAAALNQVQREYYDRLRQTLDFDEQYRNATGRSYLANYRRAPPRVFMWPADYFGQEHWVTSDETHFREIPPAEERINNQSPEHHSPVLREYREGEAGDKGQPLLNMTLTVLSCAPRVFEIQNFLSPAEVQHLHELAGTMKLRRSQTGGGSGNSAEDKGGTRTSFNSWLNRQTSPVVDAIYRRAAHLERIDEALMRPRKSGEREDVAERKSYAEPLQLVHYDVGQEYTAHHDFGYTYVDGSTRPTTVFIEGNLHNQGQSVRYSTLLMYLNEPEEGGETTFPRWSNAETFHELAVKPEAGKAVLFYSQLPDGNLDDLSQHAAKPVLRTEKWMINLWFSNPVYVDDEY